MIRPLLPDELDPICERVAAIDPWQCLKIQPGTIAQNFRLDDERQALVYEKDNQILGLVIYRVRHFTPLVMRHGFGPVLASHYNLPWPCESSDIPDGGYVVSLVVFPGGQGEGIGSQLLDAAEAETRRSGVFRHYLMVSDFNSRAQKFYDRQGYCCIGMVDDCLQPRNRERLMEKVSIP